MGTKKNPNKPAYRSFASDVVLSLGLIEATGALYPPKDSEQSKDGLKSVCPFCDEAHLARQYYQCEHNPEHKGFTQKDCAKAKEDENGNLIKLTAEQVEAATSSSLPANRMDLRIHRTSDVAAQTLPSGTKYVFVPEAGSKFYGVLLDYLESDPDVVIMGVMNSRNTDKLFRLTSAMGGQLMFEELAWPEDVREFKTIERNSDPSLVEMAKTLIEGSVTPFDPTNYRKLARERMQTLVETVAAGQAVPVEKVKPNTTESTDDLAAMLQAAIAAQKAS